MAYINKVQISTNDNSYLIEPTLFATAGGTGSALSATISDFGLVIGAQVNITITQAILADATLNVNNTGAKTIYYNNEAITAGSLTIGRTYTFIYDGSHWIVVGDIDTNTTYTNGTGLDLNGTTFSVKYGNTAGTAAQGNDSRLSDARTPTSHTHGQITNEGELGTASMAVVTNGSKVITTANLSVSDPEVPSSGVSTSLSFIDTISQNAQGKISVSKKNVQTVSASQAGVAPQGETVTTQNQNTKFLRSDGTWQAPSYTTNTDEKVAQVGNTENKEFSILLKGTNDTTDKTEGVKYGKTNGKLVTINPSTGKITAPGGLEGKASTAGVADSANAVHWNNVTNKPGEFSPASHTHGNITNDGKIGTAGKKKLVIVDTDNAVTTGAEMDTSTTNQWLNKTGNWSTPTAAQVGAATSDHNHDTTYLKLDGTNNMSGALHVLGNQSSAWNDKGILFTNGSRIGENTAGGFGIYAKEKLYIKPNSGTASSTADGIIIDGDGLYPLVNNTENLGLSDHKWNTVYATTYYGSAANMTSLTGASSGNYGPSAAVSGTNGTTMNVPYIQVDANGRITSISNKVYTAVNTWRGIQNVLTSDSTTDSLSAAQGKALANGSARDNTKLPLAGGLMTGIIRRVYSSNSADPIIQLISSNKTVYLWKIASGSDDSTTGIQNHGFALQYYGEGGQNENYLRLIADNQNTSPKKNAITIDQTGNIAIGQSTTDASYLTYINGAVCINLGTNDTTDLQKFKINGNSRSLSIGAAGLQAYSGTTASNLNLQYYGGKINLGNSNTVGITGLAQFETANGFTYSGIGAGSDNASRPIWFSYNGVTGRPVYDNDFKYNPSTNTITIGTGTLSATNYSGTAAKATKDGDGNNIIDTYATKTTVNGLLAAADAMIFKGTLGTGGTITAVPDGTSGKTYQAGYTYKVITAGKYANIQCEVGDLLIAISDSTSGQTVVNNAHWTVAQTNIDGAVTGPASVTATGNIAIFDGTTGKIIKDSGTTIANATVAVAGKATNDSDDNPINTTYLKLSGGTVTGPVIFSRTTDVVLTGTDATQPALIVGGAYDAQHLELDGNELQSKSNKTTANSLYINNLGGAVEIGNNTNSYLSARYTSDASSTTTGALRIAGGVGIVKTLYVGTGANITGTTTIQTTAAPQLKICNTATTTGNNVSIQLIRGTSVSSAYASWQISVESGDIYFKSNYDANGGAAGTTFARTALQLVRNTGDATVTGDVKAKSFTISSTDKEAHIIFSRNNWNYITMPNNSAAAISFSAGDVGDNENQKLIIFQSGLVRPNSNDKQDLGDTTHAWKTIYTNVLSGTSDVQIKTNTASTTITTATFSGTSLLPGTGSSAFDRYLGSSTYPWKTIYGKSIELQSSASTDSSAAEGFKLISSSTKYANYYINVKGTTSAVGIAAISLGNTIAQSTAENAKGVIWMYGTSSKATQIETAFTGTSGHSIMYFPNHAGPGYLVHTEGTAKVGDTNAPVYIAANGRVTACTTYANATVAVAGKATNDSDGNAINTTYLKLAGGTMTGDIAFTSTGASGTTGTSKKITWSGSTDNASIYYTVPSADAGRLVINTGDDTNCVVAWAYKDSIKAYTNNSTPSFYPATTNTGSIGTSSFVWANMYATTFHGALEGNASTASAVAWSGVTGAPGNVTRTTDGFMSKEDKIKLDDMEVIKGTQTGKTGNWTGTSSVITSLYDGLTIKYYLNRDPSGNASLNLTLADGTTTGAIPCYYNSGRLTTHYAVGSVITLTYFSAGSITVNGTATTDNRWIADANYDSGNTNTVGYLIRYNNGTFTTTTTLNKYKILLQYNETSFVPASITNTTDATKQDVTSSTFLIFGDYCYYTNTGEKSANTTIPVGEAWLQYPLDLRYSFNTASTLTANKDVYLVAIPSTDGIHATLRNPTATGDNAKATATGTNAGPITQTLPNSNDGFIYIRLGHAYDDHCITLTMNHPVYWYKNGEIRPYQDSGIKFKAFSAAYGTTGWKDIQGRTNSSILTISKPTDAVTWGTIAHSAALTFGTGDTKGMLDVSYNSPFISIAGGNTNGSTDAAPKWYFKLSATSGKTYTLPTDSKTLCASDGSNASGSWGISITGNASTATALQTSRKIWGRDFNGSADVTGDLDWDSDTYRQRIKVSDNSTANDDVFTFSQSTDSGSNYITLLSIQDDGCVWAGSYTKNTAQTYEHDLGVRGGAGKIYFWSAAAVNGTRGIYLRNANESTSSTLMTVNQSNQITGFATIACKVNISYANTAVSTPMMQLTDSATATVAASGKWMWGISHVVSNLAAGGNTCFITGKANGTNNSAVFGFHYADNNSDNNYADISLYGNNGLLKVFKTGQVNISTNITSSSTSTGSLVVAGGVGIAGKLYVGDTVSVGTTTAGPLGLCQTDGLGIGLSLYGGPKAKGSLEYGIMFAKTATFGKLGGVSSDWATYFTMNRNDARGWIFKSNGGAANGNNNVTSIAGNGNIYTTGSLTIAKSAAGAIYLSRSDGPNWIQSSAQPIAFCINATLAGANGSLRIADTYVDSYNNEIASLGTSTVQWNGTYSKSFIVNQKVTLQWNSTDSSLDFVFA